MKISFENEEEREEFREKVVDVIVHVDPASSNHFNEMVFLKELFDSAKTQGN